SQYPGMGADLAMRFPQARAAWDEAAGLELGDRPLHQVVFPVPAFTDAEREAQNATLTATEWAQPALAAASLAQLRLLDVVGGRAECVGGNSFGELVALHAAGAFDAVALLRLARRRGELMRDAARSPGAMLAIACPPDAVEDLLSEHAGRLWVANYNSPQQTVVSGRVEAIESVARQLERRGVTARPLTAATAFHSPVVADAGNPLLEFLHELDIAAPRLQVYGNADAAPYPTEPDAVRARIADHLAAPVRFTEQIRAMYAAGVRTFVEVGAGETLTRLVGDILGDADHLAVSLDRKHANRINALHNALGRLAVHGVAVDLAPLRPQQRPKPPSQADGKRLTRTVTGASYGRPYPPVGGAD